MRPAAPAALMVALLSALLLPGCVTREIFVDVVNDAQGPAAVRILLTAGGSTVLDETVSLAPGETVKLGPVGPADYTLSATAGARHGHGEGGFAGSWHAGFRVRVLDERIDVTMYTA